MRTKIFLKFYFLLAIIVLTLSIKPSFAFKKNVAVDSLSQLIQQLNEIEYEVFKKSFPDSLILTSNDSVRYVYPMRYRSKIREKIFRQLHEFICKSDTIIYFGTFEPAMYVYNGSLWTPKTSYNIDVHHYDSLVVVKEKSFVSDLVIGNVINGKKELLVEMGENTEFSDVYTVRVFYIIKNKEKYNISYCEFDAFYKAYRNLY